MNNNLNEYNENTKGIIHLLVTSLCNRNCIHCCNKQYDLNDIPYVTDKELKNCHTLCLTGGEPFLFTNPTAIARYYKENYPNIKKVYVYTNATELEAYLHKNNLDYIDGVNVSLKTLKDWLKFDNIIKDKSIKSLNDNRVYIFGNWDGEDFGNFKVIKRVWQENFKPANDSIFRRV